MKLVSLLEASVQVRLTCSAEVDAVAARVLGAVGALPVVALAILEKAELVGLPIAWTR